MRKITLVVLLISISAIATAQQMYLEGGKLSSTFKYENSKGKSLENLQVINNSYMAIGYSKQLLTGNLHLNIGANYSSYGAISSDAILENFMEWNVDYAGLNVGLDYTVLNINNTSVFVKGGMSGSFFIQGNQTLNKSVIDLKNNEDFDTTLFNMNVGIGLLHPVSENLSFYVQYMYRKSLDLASGKEELKIISNTLGFGLLINISKKEDSEKLED